MSFPWRRLGVVGGPDAFLSSRRHSDGSFLNGCPSDMAAGQFLSRNLPVLATLEDVWDFLRKLYGDTTANSVFSNKTISVREPLCCSFAGDASESLPRDER